MAIDLRWRSVSFYNDISLFPIVGSINILYVDRAAMLIYIWNGSSYEATEGGSGGSSITVVANYTALPDPTTVTASFYWCSASQGTAWLPGPLGGSYYNSGLYYSNGTTWEYMSSPYQATQVEVDAGVISDKFVTPNTLYNSSKWGTKQNAITLTTTGSGAATFIADTLNIPTASGGTPAGLTGQIQFNNGGVFGADSGLFWDNTNKRLGIGATPASTVRLDVRAQGALSTDIAFRVRNSANTVDLFKHNGDGSFIFRNNSNTAFSLFDGINTFQQYAGGATLSNIIGNFTRIQSNGAAVMGVGTESHLLISYVNGNFQLEETSGILQTSGKGGLSLKNAAVIPSANTPDRFTFYSADITAGNAAPHFRTENGSIVKLYQETSVTTPQGIADALTNLGVLASSTIANSIPTHDGATYDTNAIQTVTAAEYAALTPNASTIYFII